MLQTFLYGSSLGRRPDARSDLDTPADQATASSADPPGLSVSVSASASQYLIIKVLRRPVEFTQYPSMRRTNRLADASITPLVGSQGGAFNNALAESVIRLLKTTVIRRKAVPHA